MSAPGIVVVSLAALAQVALGRWVSAPWMVPDLVAVTLVLVLARSASPVGVAATAAASTVLTSWQRAWPLAVAYGATAWLVRWAGRRWDLSDRWVQLALVAVAQAGSVFVLGAGTGPGPAVLIGRGLVRIALTCACVPLVGALVAATVPPPSGAASEFR